MAGMMSMLMARDNLHYFIKQDPVRRNCVAATNRGVAFPRCERAACFLDDGQQRRAIPHVHHWIEHYVRASSGHHRVPITIAPCARGLRAALDFRASIAKTITLA